MPPTDEDHVAITFTLERGQHQRLKELAASQHRTMSQELRYLIERALPAAEADAGAELQPAA